MKGMLVALVFGTGLVCSVAVGDATAETIWHSPLKFTTADASLTIAGGSPTTTVRVTADSPGDLKWVELGLTLPSNVQVDSVLVCYELADPTSFISQVRLTRLTTPDAAFVMHDDGTDLIDVGPVCYTTNQTGSFDVAGTITLSLRLNFASNAHWIDIGGVAIYVTETLPPRRIGGDEPIREEVR